MERLEEILHAEERARRTLSEARERASEIRREAVTEAERILGVSAREAQAEAETLEASVLNEADGEAARIAGHGETLLGEALARAESRFDDAVSAVVRTAVGE